MKNFILGGRGVRGWKRGANSFDYNKAYDLYKNSILSWPFCALSHLGREIYTVGETLGFTLYTVHNFSVFSMKASCQKKGKDWGRKKVHIF